MYDDMHLVEADRRSRLAELRVAQWLELTPPAFQRRGVLEPDVARWVAGLLDGSPADLVLIGDVGVGKTWHTYAAIKAALEGGYDGGAKFMTSMAWRRAVTPPIDFAQLDRLNRVGVLILDDLGAVRVNDWDRENLLEVVNARWEHGLPTVVTSNVSDLKSMVGPRIASRLAENRIMVTLRGPDRRREGK